MKTISTLYLAILLTLAGPPRTHAQEPRTDINPALLYYQAFLLAPDLPKEDRHYLFESQDWLRGERLPDRFGELVSFYGKQFRYAKQAARCTVPCDWGIDITPGPNTLLPHLAKCKGIAQAGRLHTMWALQQGRQAEARDNLIACPPLLFSSPSSSRPAAPTWMRQRKPRPTWPTPQSLNPTQSPQS